MTLSGRTTLVAVGVLTAYVAIFFAGLGAVAFAPAGSHVASWWPASGISVSLLLLTPRRWCLWLALGVAVVSGFANLAGGRSELLSVAFGLGNAAEALTVCRLLRGRTDRTPSLARLEDLWRLLVATAAGVSVLALVAAAGVSADGSGDALSSIRSTWPSHAAAILVIVPVALMWPLGRRRVSWGEYAVQVVALVATTILVFAPQQQTQLAFATLPLLVWAALRLDARTVTLEVLAVSIAAVVLTSSERGPFHAAIVADHLSPAASGALLQTFLLAAVAMALPLAIEVEERRRLMASVSASEMLFRRNFTESMTGMLLLRRQGNRLEVVDANDTARDLLDDTPDDPVTGRLLDRVLTPSAALRSATHALATYERDGWRGQLGIVARPGSVVDVALAPLADGDDRTYSAQLLDVTELHRARARSEEAEKLTGATLDTTASIIMLTDLEGTLLRCNTATLELSGFAEEQLVGKPLWTHLVPPARVNLAKAMFSAEGVAGFPWKGEGPFQTASGAVRRVLWSTALVRDDAGVPTHAVMTGVDVTTERVTTGQIRLLLEAGITTAIVGVDVRGRITLFNSGAETMTGRTAEEVEGTPFVDLIDPEELAERTRDTGAATPFGALTATLTSGGESVVRDWTWVSADGERHIVSMSVSGGGSDHGPQMGYLVVARDVTEQRESQLLLMHALEKERQAVDRLRALDLAKNDFVSTVSHELRTPVTSIVGYTELLQESDPLPTQVKMLEAISRNGDRLIAMCDDLLTLGAIDSGSALREAGGHADLTAVLRGAEEAMRPVAGGRQVELRYAHPGGALPVRGDHAQLERVVTNLVGNAVKFTPDGGRVDVDLQRRGDEACLVVRDTGMGIPEQEQRLLFQRFFRSSTSQNLAIQGSGLGLSIVAGIVDAHGGRIDVESVEGEGSTFTVWLPLAHDVSVP